MGKEHTILIEGGRMKFVYDDDLADLVKDSDMKVCRASHVEPASDYCVTCLKKFEGVECTAFGHSRFGVGWIADMEPSGGPVLTSKGIPFETRQEALAAERRWLEKEKGL